MAFQSVPGTAEAAVLVTSSDGKIRQMTFFARQAGGYTLGSLQNLANSLDSWAAIQYRPIVSNEVTYLRTEVRGLEFENDQVAQQGAGTGVGGIAVARLPMNVSFAVKRASGLTGRSARGRVYWVGLTEAQVVADTVIVAARNSILAALNNLHASIILTGWENVVVSRYSNGVKRPVGVTFGFPGWSVTNDLTDSQRNRLPELH